MYIQGRKSIHLTLGEGEVYTFTLGEEVKTLYVHFSKCKKRQYWLKIIPCFTFLKVYSEMEEGQRGSEQRVCFIHF